jgi:AcrR family transcriptional regulator
MPSALEKARRDPASMKARILGTARRVFGANGYHGTTTRMIAKAVGIDISTLYYHWGEKKDLYEAVIADLNEELRLQFLDVEDRVKGQCLAARLETAIEMMCDYLFAHPAVANLILRRYVHRCDPGQSLEVNVTGHVTNIAIAMGLAPDKQNVPIQAKAQVLTLWHAVLNFIAGEQMLGPMLGVARPDYVKVVKETLKFVLIPAFTAKTAKGR